MGRHHYIMRPTMVARDWLDGTLTTFPPTEAGAADKEAKDSYGGTPLHRAVDNLLLALTYIPKKWQMEGPRRRKIVVYVTFGMMAASRGNATGTALLDLMMASKVESEWICGQVFALGSMLEPRHGHCHGHGNRHRHGNCHRHPSSNTEQHRLTAPR